MALTVGELNAVLSIDDRAVDPALRRAENAVRDSGQRMGDTAERTGEDVGEELGDGIVRGADGRLRNARGRFIRAGQQAGAAVGTALAEEAAEGADQAVEETGSRLDRLKMMAAGAGLAAGAVMMTAFGQALEQSQIKSKLAAQLGATGPEAAKYGAIAGQLFTDAIVTDFQQGADTIRAIAGAGLLPPKATNAQIKSIATNAADLANTFEVDVAMAANAAGAMIKNGLAKNSGEAFDLLTKGMTGLGPASDDLLETFGEYSPVFKAAGLSGATALGLMRQAIQGGWVKDTDKIGDAFKELSLRATEGSKAVTEGLKAMGLDAKKVGDDIAAGGTRGEAAMGLILDRLRKMGPETQTVKQLVSTLFGGPGEDLGAALFALHVGEASESLGNVTGAADKMGDSLRDNATAKVEHFKRQAMQGLVDILGTRVIPMLERVFSFVQEHGGAFKVAAIAVTAVLIPALTLLAVTATVKMGVVVWAWMTSAVASIKAAATHVSSALSTAGAWAMMALRATGSFLAVAASATANALRTAAAWAAAGVRMTATFLASVLRVAAVTVAQFAMMAGRAIVWAATMAAQWLIAMGPIGWIIAAVIGLVALIIANWDKIKKYTVQAWDAIWKGIKQVGQFILNYIIGWKLVSYFLQHWDRIKSGVAAKGGQLLAWFKGLPGRLSSALGSLGSLLYDKGVNVVQGLWRGIQSMGGWIRGQIMSWARNVIPGPIAKVLGIASPSKVTAKQGEWIARGLVVGMTAGMAQIRSTASKMAGIIIDATTVKLTPKRKGGSKKQNRAIDARNKQLLQAAGAQRSKALKILNSGSSQLLKLASAEERVASKLKAANKSLQDQIKARNTLAADVRQGVLDAADITQTSDQGGTTATSIWANLNAQLQKAKTFAAQLATLRKKGVRADLIAQIAQAGVEQGSAAAAALATASSGQIAQINSTQAQLVAAATQAGNTAGDAMYGAGIRAAQGLVMGLQKQQSAIERQMLVIATGMQKAIKKALGIRSPSRVMAAVGQYIPAGLIRGIESGRSAVDASMANLVKPPTPAVAGAGAYGPAGGAATYGRTGAPIVIEFKSSGTPRGDYLVQEMRQAVKNGGGDVQVVLGQRRR